MKFSKDGYKKNSEDNQKPFLFIQGGEDGTSITMEDVTIPVMGIDNLGYSELMTPGGEYKFPGSTVLELPLNKKAYGGPGGMTTVLRNRLYDRKRDKQFAEEGTEVRPTPMMLTPPIMGPYQESTLTEDEIQMITNWVSELKKEEERKNKNVVSSDNLSEDFEAIDNDLNNNANNQENETNILDFKIKKDLDLIKNAPSNLKDHSDLLSTDLPDYNAGSDLYFEIDSTGGLGQTLNITDKYDKLKNKTALDLEIEIEKARDLISGTDTSELTDIIVKSNIQEKLHLDNLTKNLQIKERKKADATIEDLEKQYYQQYVSSNYSLADAESVRKVQQDVVDAGLGHLLGKFGPNKDGIDGKYGPKTKNAVRQMLANEINSLGTDYNFTEFWNPVEDGYTFNNSQQCTSEGCADMVIKDFQNSGVDVEKIGISGNNAWNMYDALTHNNGISKYNIFENMESPTSVEDARNKMYNAIKEDPIYVGPTKEDIQSPLEKGDVVGIFFPNSTYQEVANNQAGGLGARKGSNPTYNSHVGYVIGHDVDGTPLIKHSFVPDNPETQVVEGRSVITRADELKVAGVDSYITWAVEPAKFQLNKTFDRSNIKPVIEQDEMDLMTDEYLKNLELKIERPITDPNKKEMIKFQYETITNSIATIADELGIVAPYDIIRDVQLGIQNVETGIGGGSVKNQKFIDMRGGKASIEDIVKLYQDGKITDKDLLLSGGDEVIDVALNKGIMGGGGLSKFNFLFGKDDDYETPFEATNKFREPEDISRGLYNTKLSQASPLYLHYYGLNENNIDKVYNTDGSLNKENAEAAINFQTSRLLRTYDTFNSFKQRFNNKFPNDPMTEEDVINMMIMSHNQGTDILLNFTQTGRTHGAKNSDGDYIHTPKQWEVEQGLVDGSPWDVEDYLFELRRMYRGNVKDYTSTDWKHLDAINPGLGKWFYNIDNPDGHESYVSKVKRYVDNKNVPWTAYELNEYLLDLETKRDEILVSSTDQQDGRLTELYNEQEFVNMYIDKKRLEQDLPEVLSMSTESRLEAEAREQYAKINSITENIDQVSAILNDLKSQDKLNENLLTVDNPEDDDEALASRKEGGEINSEKLFPEWDGLQKDLAMYRDGNEISDESKMKLADLGFELKPRDKYENYPTDMIVSFIDLKNFKPGGDITLDKQVDIYEDYINGRLKSNKATKVYDKLNRFYYYAAKGKEMSILDYMKHKLKQS